MAFCTICGTQNQDTSAFCANCGSNMKGSGPQSSDMTHEPQQNQNSYVNKSQVIQNQGYPPQQYPRQQAYNQYGYQQGQFGIRPPRTGWLTLVLVINWLIVAGVLMGGILLLGIAGEFVTVFGFGGSFIASIALIIILFGGLWAWLTINLNRYNNTARIINLILLVLGFLINLVDIDIVSIVISGAQIYALGFHKETIALFKPEQRFMHSAKI